MEFLSRKSSNQLKTTIETVLESDTYEQAKNENNPLQNLEKVEKHDKEGNVNQDESLCQQARVDGLFSINVSTFNGEGEKKQSG